MDSPRRVTLVDLMTIVVAAAGGMALDRGLAVAALEYPWGLPTAFKAAHVMVGVRYGASAVYPYVLTLTLAVLLLRLRRPRPELREAFGRPGLAGCVAAAAVFVFAALWLTPPLLEAKPRQMYIDDWRNLWERAPRAAGYAVAGSWASLVVSGAWEPERAWLDRLGRGTGALWLMSIAIDGIDAWGRFLMD